MLKFLKVQILLQRGFSSLNNGKAQEAISYFKAVLKINPNNDEAHNNLGMVLTQKGKFDEAVTHFSYALRINPSFEKARKNLEFVKGIDVQDKASKTDK